ncbi:MAG TPA: ATP-binding protein [Phaeodactylibacter sp.]|nr:ATP-binding protein [Phaeodactylibacter sp.]
MYINRLLEGEVREALRDFPVVAILGPRQVGKSTLAKHLWEALPEDKRVYLDLELPSDLAKLGDAEWFFSQNEGKLICIDEIQRKADLFPVIRSLVDRWGGNGHFLILGSASMDLIRQSSETLAGRISFHYLGPFAYEEIKGQYSLEEYILRGGFPRSLLARSIEVSMRWRENFITTFIERDLSNWFQVSPGNVRRLWQMLAHWSGQALNYSSLSNSLDISSITVKRYLDLLQGTYMLHVLSPYLANVGKRLVKSPKVYLADSGLMLTFLGITDFNHLLGHPSLGRVWETVVLANLKVHFPFYQVYFYRTAQGAEIDFVLTYGDRLWALECKASLSPALRKGNKMAVKDIGARKLLVVAPVKQGWRMQEGGFVVSLEELPGLLKE